ncbi:peptidase S28 [Neoconidiobolus thromboides FSU 785]|nr:peptidase S28 [Neoconidiobolus thromboides FSU 785]
MNLFIRLFFLLLTCLNITYSLRAIAAIDYENEAGIKPIPLLTNKLEPMMAEGKGLIFQQRVDHFNLNDNRNFSQRYYQNDNYYKVNGPLLLYIGGEGKLVSRSSESGFIVRIAQQLQAMIYTLEHRYYGESRLFEDMSVDNLSYLSSLQSLKDIESFLQSKRKENQKVIVVGGSYAGNLAAWSRKLFPNLIDAALASSAPVKALGDFYQYDQITAISFGEKCANIIANFTKNLDTLLNSKNSNAISKVKEQFECQSVIDDTMFVSVLSDMFATAVQYNRPNVPFNVNTVCSNIDYNMSFNEYLAYFSTAAKIYFKSQNKSCYDLTFIDEIKDIKYNPDNANRQWTYQTCTEFGYYQTAPNSGISLRSQRLTYDWIYNTVCSKQHFSKLIGPPKVEDINQRYGGNELISKVIYTNGKLDPWSYLSVLPNKDSPMNNDISNMNTSNNLVLLITSASHTQDLLPDFDNDPLDLRLARSLVLKKLAEWIN